MVHTKLLSRALVSVAAAAGLVAATATVASEAGAMPMPMPKPTQMPQAALSIHGDAMIGPGLRLLRVNAWGLRDHQGKTTGDYRAQVLNGVAPTGLEVVGPVTCVSVHGNTASLIYPISQVKPFMTPNGLADSFAVQITVRKGANDKGSMLGVNGPMPTTSFHGCAPTATPFNFDGKIMMMGR